MYNTVEEVKQKLVNSVVLFDGFPVYIQNAAKNKKEIELFYLKVPILRNENIKPEVAFICDPKWDFKTFGTKLGYVSVKNPLNEKFESLFITRVPIRHSRQGLDDRTTLLTSCPEEGSYKFSWNDVIYNKSTTINNTIKNQFPSIESAFNTLINNYEYHSIPIHRKITILYDQISPPYIIYRNDKIGYSEDGKIFKLAKHKNYLREELTDMIGLKIS